MAARDCGALPGAVRADPRGPLLRAAHPDRAVIHESPQYQELFGYKAEEIAQPDFWKTLIHPEDREWVLAENERVDRTGDPWNVEYRALAKDGRVVWLRDHAVLVRGEHGEPDYWQGYYIDITEQKQAEE
ncbi:MAG TPA: PAS domain-containing protein, partial [Actinomycetes bacterium]|nr:PAS domain-containing protein [Actinomycetes bacterium]